MGTVTITGAIMLKSSKSFLVNTWKFLIESLALILYLKYSINRRILAIWNLGTGSLDLALGVYLGVDSFKIVYYLVL